MKPETNRAPADPSYRISRRRVIGAGLATMAWLLPGAALADEWVRIFPEPPKEPAVRPRISAPAMTPRDDRSADRPGYPRSLTFYNVHTGESLNRVYWAEGEYVAGALNEIDYFFRDFRANEVKPIDPRLLDVLYDLHSAVGTTHPINLVSGYRSYATNAWLAAQSEGVARHSMHIEGKAADIHIPGVELAQLHTAALSLGAGGVGYYPRANFVHVDTGRVRRW